MGGSALEEDRRRQVLVVLVVAGTLSQTSNYLLSFFYSIDGGLRSDLGIGPSLFSVLVGYVAGIPRCLTQLLAGQLGDRPRCFAGALIVQALGSLILSIATRPWHVILSQIIVGLGSGPLFPLGSSMIADIDEKPAAANGIFAQTIYFGPALASGLCFFARATNWRRVVQCTALALALSTLPFWTSFQRRRTRLSSSSSPAGERKCMALSVGLLALGGGFRYGAGYAVPSYVPLFFNTTYPEKEAVFSTLNAVAIFLCGSTSAFLGGQLAGTHLLRVPVLSCLFGGICAGLTFFSRSFSTAVFALCGMQLLGEAWLPGVLAALRDLGGDPVDRSFGLFYATATALGSANLLLLGHLHLDRRTMLFAVALPYFIAATLFLLVALRLLQRDNNKNPSSSDSVPNDKTPLLLRGDGRGSSSDDDDGAVIPSQSTNPFHHDFFFEKDDDDDDDTDDNESRDGDCPSPFRMVRL